MLTGQQVETSTITFMLLDYPIIKQLWVVKCFSVAKQL